MRFTKWGEYGILFCVYIANQSTHVGAAQVGKAHGVPTQYAQQILHRLRRSGVVKSTRGPHGGFQLVKTPEALTMKEILTAAEGSTFEVMCESSPVFSSCSDDNAPCTVKFVWQELKEKIDTALEAMTLKTIMERGTKDELIGIASRSTSKRRATIPASQETI